MNKRVLCSRSQLSWTYFLMMSTWNSGTNSWGCHLVFRYTLHGTITSTAFSPKYNLLFLGSISTPLNRSMYSDMMLTDWPFSLSVSLLPVHTFEKYFLSLGKHHTAFQWLYFLPRWHCLPYTLGTSFCLVLLWFLRSWV